ncbi:MAG: transcription initiation factor IIB [Candidatus Aenigmatarchaeota archaeon]|jgi:transcription initiation factor TFIIB
MKKKEKIEEEKKKTLGLVCPECGSTNIIQDPVRGELICQDCGAVISEESIDTTQDWRAFDSEQMSRRARGGAPLTFSKHDMGLTTEIGKGVLELYKVTPSKRAQYYRMTKWQKRLIRSKDRNLSYALSELQRVVSFLGLSRAIHEKIAKYYNEAVNRNLIRGRSIEAVIAALTYAVTREMGSPRTLEEILQVCNVDKREVGRAYRFLARELKIRILPADPASFIPRFCSMLGLSDKVQAKALEIIKKVKKIGLSSGKGPTGIAAAAIYIASVLVGERRSQREIADILGITEVTIRNRFKEIVTKLGIEKEIEKLTGEKI